MGREHMSSRRCLFLSLPHRIGYVAVVNRGQRDIDNNQSIREAIRKEAQFFKGHPVYRNLLKQ